MRERLFVWGMVQLWTIVILAILAALAGIGYGIFQYVQWEREHYRDPVWKVLVDQDDKLNFDETAAIATRLHKLTEAIQATGWKPKASPARLHTWTTELLPMYQYEGVTNKTRLPLEVKAIAVWDGTGHNHLAGRSDCAMNVWINGRYVNPVSRWYSREGWIAVLAHELAHLQQGPIVCGLYESEKLENTAQLVAWEVLAALANQGNKDAAYSLIFELKGVAMSAAKAQGTREQYDDLIMKLYGDDPERLARVDKGMRFWASRPLELKEILQKYSAQPLNIVHAYRRTVVVHQLALPTYHKTLAIDDLLYFLTHAEDLIGAYLDQPDLENSP